MSRFKTDPPTVVICNAARAGIYFIGASLYVGGKPTVTRIEVRVDNKEPAILLDLKKSIEPDQNTATVAGATALKLKENERVSIWVNAEGKGLYLDPNATNAGWFTIAMIDSE